MHQDIIFLILFLGFAFSIERLFRGIIMAIFEHVFWHKSCVISVLASLLVIGLYIGFCMWPITAMNKLEYKEINQYNSYINNNAHWIKTNNNEYINLENYFECIIPDNIIISEWSQDGWSKGIYFDSTEKYFYALKQDRKE